MVDTVHEPHFSGETSQDQLPYALLIKEENSVISPVPDVTINSRVDNFVPEYLLVTRNEE